MNKIFLISFLFSTCSKTEVVAPKMDYLEPSKTVIEVVQNYDYSAHYLYKWMNNVVEFDVTPYSNVTNKVKVQGKWKVKN